MKSYEFIKNLNEDIEPDYQGGPSKEKLTVNDGLLEEIEIECSNAIVSMRNASKFLYRGIDISSSQAYPFRSTTRTNRMPKDTPHELQDAFNDIMDICRIRTNRSNSIFCTSEYGTARNYGVEHIIFPMNGSNILWADRVRDLYKNPEAKDDLREFLNSDGFKEKIANAKAFVQKWGYHNSDLTKALTSRNEIMINGSYYAIPMRLLSNLQLRELLGLNY